jgi:quinol monooxygenase YgiN
MITFIAHMQVPAASAAAFEELMTSVCRMSRDEPGVIHYSFAEDVDQPGTYVVVEVYRDQAAVTAHGDTDWVRQSVPKFLRLIDGVPRIAQYVSPGTPPIGSQLEG